LNRRIKGNTKLFAVIGDPISHSISPEIHNTIFDRIQANNIYIPLKIKASELEQYIPVLRNNFAGFNVTIPHKQRIISYLDDLDERAKFYGAVNTVKVVDGRLIGYNTDGYGFIKSLEAEGIDITGKKVLLIGAGGAARVAAFEILQKGAFLTIANRTLEKAQNLKQELVSLLGIDRIDVCRLDEVDKGYFCIVNATPVGMWPEVDEMPIRDKVLKGAKVVYDMVYNPYRTKLLQYAEEYGCKGINGFPMLFYQAVKAQEIWADRYIGKELLFPIYEEIEAYLYKKK